MNNFDDDFGPWSTPQPSTGYCPFCKMEKEESDIFMSVPEDMINTTIKSLNLTGEENHNNLPLILCKSCHLKIERKMRKINECFFGEGFDGG